MPTGYTSVTASKLTDATGTTVANATISFQPVTSSGVETSFYPGGGGAVMSSPVQATVTNGAFTIQLADTTLTQPVNIGYRVTVTDNVTGKSLLGLGYSCVQPYGSTWSFDAYQANVAAVATVQTGPRGIQGLPNSLAVGTVTTGAAGSSASATITGTAPNQTLNLTLPTGEAGPPGDVNGAQLVQFVSAATTVDKTKQLFDRLAITDGVQIGPGGGLIPRSNCRVSDFIPTGTMQWIASQQLVGGSTTDYGVACYDVNKAFIGFQSPSGFIAAGTPVTPLAGTVYTRLMYFTSASNPIGAAAVNDTTLMVNFGNTVAPLIPFGPIKRSEIPNSNSISDVAASVVAAALNAEAGITRNRILTWTRGALTDTDVLQFTTGQNYTTDYIPIDEPLVANDVIFGQANTWGIGFYDINKVRVRTLYGNSSTGIAVAAGTQIVPQSGERFIRFTVMLAGNAAAATPITNLATFALSGGSSAPAFSEGGLLTVAKGKQLFAQNFTSGKKFGVFGDSLSGRNSFNRAWQNAFITRTGMTFAFQDAIAGRRWLHDSPNPSGGTVHGIFHHYGGGAGTGTCDTGTVYGSANANDEDTFGCSVGQTLAQVLAPLDLLIIELGTNELNTSSGGNTPLGTPSDAIGTDTVYGGVKNALNTIVTAKPALTVIVVGPAFTSFGTYSTIQANDQAIEYCCNLYSVPYLSMFKQMGMNDVNRMSISDGVHPVTSFSQNRYGPMIASFAERFI